MCMCISICTLGVSGGMLPQDILVFRLSETASGAFLRDFVVN